MRTVLALAAIATAAGCFNPSVRECAVTCSALNPCPSGASCLTDGFCHASPDDSLCDVADAGVDAVPADAGLACGNSLVEVGMGEECDDGNRDSGDGCSSACAEEPGFVCVEQPSQCRPNPSVAGDLVITELLANPTGVDFDKEWFELFNPTQTDFDLRDMVARDDGGEMFTIAVSLVVPAGGYAVLGQSTNTAVNGNAPVQFAYANALQLSNAAGGDELEVLFGTTVIDRVTFSLPPDGAALSLSGATLDHISNDDAANFCAAVDGFGDNGDLGTPGMTNPDC